MCHVVCMDSCIWIWLAQGLEESDYQRTREVYLGKSRAGNLSSLWKHMCTIHRRSQVLRQGKDSQSEPEKEPLCESHRAHKDLVSYLARELEKCLACMLYGEGGAGNITWTVVPCGWQLWTLETWKVAQRSSLSEKSSILQNVETLQKFFKCAFQWPVPSSAPSTYSTAKGFIITFLSSK